MKAKAATLSAHLLEEAQKFIAYPNRVRRAKAEAEFVEETLWPLVLQLGVVQKGKALPLQGLLDEFFVKKLVGEVPEYVDRTRLLPTVEHAGAVPRQVNLYLEQASWCFVLGLWDGVVALSRACLEAALEDRVGERAGRQMRDLKGWIAEAEKLRLDAGQLKRARDIQVLGNKVLHERSATPGEAKLAILTLRAFVTSAYR